MLARCNQRLGAAHAEQNLLLAGLKASRQGASSKDRCAVPRLPYVLVMGSSG